MVIDTVEELHKERDVQGAILHSDQSFPYTSQQYNKRLEEKLKTGIYSTPGAQVGQKYPGASGSN
ncbi:hypothetical protein PMI08_02568 [Brevibacillus sp. CF112]|nr:hypothetical protein PMI08_02568 [Brevibacillus sp. CF112]MBG9567196.1 hypothetical protein [Brevibacillus agri]